MKLRVHINRRRRTRGISVAEMLMYIALLAMFSTLVFKVYQQATRQTLDLNQKTRIIAQAMYAGERWREDVRQSTRPPQWIESGWRQARVMRLVTPSGNIDYFVQGSKVWRKVNNHPKEMILFNVNASQMLGDTRGAVPVVRWELEIKIQGVRRAQARPLFTFLAVPSMPPDVAP